MTRHAGCSGLAWTRTDNGGLTQNVYRAVRLQTPTLFLLLIASQSLHSIEEYIFRLWDVLAPARYVSGLFSTDLALGFGLANFAIIAFGLGCYFAPVRRQWQSACAFMWFWALLELANSIGHSLFALSIAGYFPGLYTAPLLFLGSTALLFRLLQNDHRVRA